MTGTTHYQWAALDGKNLRNAHVNPFVGVDIWGFVLILEREGLVE